MNEKLDELALINGSPIGTHFLKLQIVFIVIIFGLFVSPISFSLSFTNESIMPIMISIPYFIVVYGTTVPLFTLQFYQKCRYYMIPATSVYKYYLHSIFSIKNMVIIILSGFTANLLYYLIADASFYSFLVSYIKIFLISPAIISLSFAIGTLVEDKHKYTRVFMPVIVWFIAMICFIVSIAIGGVYTILAFLIIDIAALIAANYYSHYRERKMEV